MPGCVFQTKWTNERELQAWIKRDPSNAHAAYCRVCNKSIDISTMGHSALVSHSKGKKHKEKMTKSSESEGQGRLDDFFCSNSMTSSSSATPDSAMTKTSDQSQPSGNRNIDSYFSSSEVLDAEILWCFKTVDSNFSFSSNQGVTNLFTKMFPDSNIAKHMSCAETKSMYMTCFGLAPYCSVLLERKLQNQPFVLMFDESLNREMQKKQLDIILRHWDCDKVTDSYYTSTFLGHACATDLVSCFEEHIESHLGYNNLIQLAMDGPNVNWAAFDTLQKKIQIENMSQLINIGSCGLHQLHNAFRSGMGETKWDITHSLSAMYTLLNDVPARRDDFQSATQTSVYPLQVCSHRWVENIPVCERAIQLIPAINQYIEQVQSKKYKNPGTKSYETVKKFVKDPLCKVKLLFTIAVAKPVESFLVIYQTDKPMAPFLAEDFGDVLRSCMKRIVKQSVMAEAPNLSKLTKIDVSDETNLKLYRNIDIGFSAETELKKLLSDKKVSEKTAFEFKADCCKMLKKMISRLIERSPLDYSLLRNMTCLNPAAICNDTVTEQCKVKFKRVVGKLQSLGQLDINECDEVLDEYEKFVDSAKLQNEFQNFNKADHRIDSLFYSKLNSSASCTKLWKVLKKLLLLSHGQASVERGFSVNKEVSDTNMQCKTLVSLRTVKDHVRKIGGLTNVVISKELRQYAKSARSQYQTYLEKKKAAEGRMKAQSKRKLQEEEAETLQKRVRLLESDIKFLTEGADKASLQAEEQKKLVLVTKSNALRQKARDKADELVKVKKDLSEKLLELKNS